MTGKVYKGVEQAFGYVGKGGEHMLVAANLIDENNELVLVGATGEAYKDTKGLNVLNYRQAMDPVDREGWGKATRVDRVVTDYLLRSCAPLLQYLGA